MGNPDRDKNGVDEGVRGVYTYLAALKATAFLVPIAAVLITVFVHAAFEEIFQGKNLADFGSVKNLALKNILGVENPGVVQGNYEVAADAFSVMVGAFLAVLAWLAVALLYGPYYTAVDSVSPRNHAQLRGKLDQLKNRLNYVLHECLESRKNHENGIAGSIRSKACKQVVNECEEIEKILKRGGMSWITGIGYIELWHRVHRAEEELIKLESCTEALVGAMYDESRLIDSNMTNKGLLLEQLRCAVAVLENSATGDTLNYLDEPAKRSPPTKSATLLRLLNKTGATLRLLMKMGATSNNRAKATTVLSEVRYEINQFSDNRWEGIIHARNRLADTSVFLGFTAFVLLGIIILANASHDTILWVAACFLVGALVGFFARAQAEWAADSAIDDFGLSRARLHHIPWLSGLAAVGGVLITSVLDTQFTGDVSGGLPCYGEIFCKTPALLVVAAVFGLTPDLLIRRLGQTQADIYKEDLQSTQTSQSTQTG